MLKRKHLGKEEVVEHSENYWSGADGLKLYEQAWIPEGTPRAVINLVHGLGEHSGRYTDWASRFVREGFIVRSFDIRGHGKSPGRRGYISEYGKVIRDLEIFLQAGTIKYPDIPVFLYGHSLGGNLVLNYVMQKPLTLSGLIISSPWFELSRELHPWLLRLVHLGGILLPGIRVWNRIRTEDLSRDLRIVHSYRTDPLVHDKISLRFFSQCYKAGLKASMSSYKINSPMLIMHGSEDNVTSGTASGKFTFNASQKTRFIEWKGSYHELHNDLDRDKVFDAMISWLDHYANPETKRNA